MKGSLAVVLLLAATGHADPTRVAALDPPGMTPELAPAAPPLSPLEEAIARDALASRGGLYDTALTLPTGAIAASARAIPDGGLVTLAVGVTPFELVIDAGKTFNGQADLYGASAKLAVMRRPTWQLALEGSYHQISIGCGDCTDTNGFVTASGIGTGCLDAECRAILTLGAGMSLPARGDNVALIMTSGLMLGSGAFRGIADLAVAGDYAYGFGGVRIGGAQLALDFGAAFAAQSTTHVTPMLGIATRM